MREDKTKNSPTPNNYRRSYFSGFASKSSPKTQTTSDNQSNYKDAHRCSLNRLFGINKASPKIHKQARKTNFKSEQANFYQQEKLKYGEILNMYKKKVDSETQPRTLARIVSKISNIFSRPSNVQNKLKVNDTSNIYGPLPCETSYIPSLSEVSYAQVKTPYSSSSRSFIQQPSVDRYLNFESQNDLFEIVHGNKCKNEPFSFRGLSASSLSMNQSTNNDDTIVIVDSSDEDDTYKDRRGIASGSTACTIDQDLTFDLSAVNAKQRERLTKRYIDSLKPSAKETKEPMLTPRPLLKQTQYSEMSEESSLRQIKHFSNKTIDDKWISDMESRYKRQLKNSKLKQQQLEATITYNANKRTDWENSINNLIQHRLKISERVPQIYKEEPCPDAPIYADDDEEEEEEKEEEEEQEDIEHNSHFNPLTDEQEYLVSDCFSPSSRDKQFVEGFKLSLTGNDLSCLAGLSWLNDEVINFYMNLIMERGSITRDNQPDGVHCFNTFFYPRLIRNGHQSVKRWTKRLDVLSSRYIVVPVHLGMHWCLAIINFAKKTINYYDSMGGNNDTCLNALRNYVIEEAKDKKQIDYDMSEWTMTNLKDIPQQDNGSDCGMFACKFAEYITRDAPFNFSQKDIPYFRRRMVCELINKELM